MKSRAKVGQLKKMLGQLIQLDYRYKSGVYQAAAF